MKNLIFLLLCFSMLLITSCYTIEDADDVNQDRIATYYETNFNASRNTTYMRLDFRFGQTPLRMDEPIFFEDFRLFEKQDAITGLHYQRQIHEVLAGEYQWTDEDGRSFINYIALFEFELENPVSEIRKETYYSLPWEGDIIPYGDGYFSLNIKSEVDGTQCYFIIGTTIEIQPEHTSLLPIGPAILSITRTHSEPIDNGTQAGGESTVKYTREYEISIVE